MITTALPIQLLEGRAPLGARGLKSGGKGGPGCIIVSRSARSAWIEIGELYIKVSVGQVALRSERVD